MSKARRRRDKSLSKSQLALSWRKFKRNKLAIMSSVILLLLLVLTVFSGFFSPHSYTEPHYNFAYLPPQPIHFLDHGHLSWPFVYGIKRELDPDTLTWKYSVDKNRKSYIKFFVRGEPYVLLGVFKTNIHLFGTASDCPIFLFGTDKIGRSLFSRVLWGGKISLSVALLGTLITTILGMVGGGISGYYGGWVDMFIQRFTELLMSIPTLPLWMALSTALPRDWSSIKVFFGVTVLMSLVSWGGFSREIRALVLSRREEDFVFAAKAVGASDTRIIVRHILPTTLSHAIVLSTLTMPMFILGESSLSFLGLGIRPPMASLGVLLADAQNIQTIVQHPWLMIPGLFIIIIVLAVNFIGDGIRDAADPFSQ